MSEPDRIKEGEEMASPNYIFRERVENRLPAKDKPYILGASLEPPIYMKVVTTDGDVLTFNFSSVDEMQFVWRYLERWLNRQYWRAAKGV